MLGFLTRLRWQLTLSHLVAIAITVVTMIGSLLVIGSFWWHQSTAPELQAATDARAVAMTIGDAEIRDANSQSDLEPILRQMASGSLRVVNASSGGPPFRAGGGSSLTDVAYLVVFGLDGHVIASSDPSGATFAPTERTDWTPLVAAALGGQTDAGRLSVVRSGGGPVALGAYPIVDQSGGAIAAALVAKTALPPAGSTFDFWQTLLLFAAASAIVLTATSVFALCSSALVSYFLSRRLVRRLERLGAAAEAFAAGNTFVRAERGSSDEVGQLAARFNGMADRLADTLAELAAEKGVVEGALKAKRELIANVSHELRTPLASIRAHTESLLLGATLAGETQRYLEVIHRQSEQLSHLIDDLFLLSTTEVGALPLVLRPISLEGVVQEVLRSIEPAARAEREVHVISELEPDMPHVLADRQRVVQVLANLVRNAVRHTPEGGLVAVRTAQQADGFAMITVEDTGIGIPPEELQRVFERFYRTDPSRDRASGGAGLGLAIVRELVTAMGGEVFAESAVGEGSRFSFTLPLVHDSVTAGGARSRSSSRVWRSIANQNALPDR